MHVPTHHDAVWAIAADDGSAIEVCRAARPAKFHVVIQLPDGTRLRYSRASMAYERAVENARWVCRVRNEKHSEVAA
jgi:hypothetical protein